MAEKNTHSILETIKNKLGKLDQKKSEQKMPQVDEEFEYIAPKSLSEEHEKPAVENDLVEDVKKVEEGELIPQFGEELQAPQDSQKAASKNEVKASNSGNLDVEDAGIDEEDVEDYEDEADFGEESEVENHEENHEEVAEENHEEDLNLELPEDDLTHDDGEMDVNQEKFLQELKNENINIGAEAQHNTQPTVKEDDLTFGEESEASEDEHEEESEEEGDHQEEIDVEEENHEEESRDEEENHDEESHKESDESWLEESAENHNEESSEEESHKESHDEESEEHHEESEEENHKEEIKQTENPVDNSSEAKPNSTPNDKLNSAYDPELANLEKELEEQENKRKELEEIATKATNPQKQNAVDDLEYELEQEFMNSSTKATNYNNPASFNASQQNFGQTSNQNLSSNSMNFNSAGKVQEGGIISDNTVIQVNNSVKKLLDAKNIVSGIAGISKDPALYEIAAGMLEPKLEKWLNENLPNLVEGIVREEIKKILPKEEQK